MGGDGLVNDRGRRRAGPGAARQCVRPRQRSRQLGAGHDAGAVPAIGRRLRARSDRERRERASLPAAAAGRQPLGAQDRRQGRERDRAPRGTARDRVRTARLRERSHPHGRVLLPERPILLAVQARHRDGVLDRDPPVGVAVLAARDEPDGPGDGRGKPEPAETRAAVDDAGRRPKICELPLDQCPAGLAAPTRRPPPGHRRYDEVDLDPDSHRRCRCDRHGHRPSPRPERSDRRRVERRQLGGTGRGRRARPANAHPRGLQR